MRILISTILSTKNRVGVTEYLIGLIQSLQKIDTENNYFIITTKENRHFFDLTNSNFHEIIVNIFDISRALLRLQYLIFFKIKLPVLVRKYKIDILHEPSSWFINKRLKTVVTVHDVVEFSNSKYTLLFNFIKKRMILSSIKYSSSIIAVSNHTKREINKIYNRNGDIYKIYNGLLPVTRALPNKNISVLKKYSLLNKNYFIYVGTLLRHKNLFSLLEAFRIFYNTNKNYKLVLAGKFGNAILSLKKFIKVHKLGENIILTGYFNEDEKSSLIQNASALLLLSKEEGFGFPILEAQALGVPVITSNLSSMKEIANGSAILINPDSINSIVDGMKSIISNQQKIMEIIKLGGENIKRFTWVNSAENTLAVYKKTFLKNKSSKR